MSLLPCFAQEGNTEQQVWDALREGQHGDVRDMPTTEAVASVLSEALADDDPDVRRTAAVATSGICKLARRRVLEDDTPGDRERGEEALAVMAATEGALRGALMDPDGKVRWNVVYALEFLKDLDRATVKELIRVLSERKVARNRVTIALGRVEPREPIEIVPALAKAFSEDSETSVRKLAAQSIGRRVRSRSGRTPHHIAAVPALLKALRSDEEDVGVRDACAGALGAICAEVPKVVEALLDVEGGLMGNPPSSRKKRREADRLAGAISSAFSRLSTGPAADEAAEVLRQALPRGGTRGRLAKHYLQRFDREAKRRAAKQQPRKPR